ncbi:hypothetical protein GB937_003328 [Aspergillus fischeri]|nr:hypothetical protein GB937_003328 [Aspergillus fischeri]
MKNKDTWGTGDIISVAILVNMAKSRLNIRGSLAIVSRVDIQKRQSTDQQSVDAGSYIPSNESRAEKRANHEASTTRMMLF